MIPFKVWGPAVLVVLLVGTVVGWYRTEIERARQQGIATQMAKQADASRLAYDSAVAAHVRSDSLQRGRLLRLAHDSAKNDSLRGALAGAAHSASQRADSILATLMDSLPQLAGVRAAMDTLQQQVAAERDGRILAERGKAEALASKAELEVLLAQAGKLIAEQAATIDQLKKVGTGGSHLGTILTVGLTAAGLGAIIGASIF